MARTLRVAPHLTADEVADRFRSCRDVDEKTRWQAVMLKMRDWATVDIAQACGHEVDWVCRTVRKYNRLGPAGLEDLRRANGKQRMLTPEEHDQLAQALLGPAPDGGFWTSVKVARWITDSTGKKAQPHTGWLYLKRLGFSRQTPRPKHPDADPAAQEAFKKGGLLAVFETSFETTPEPASRSGRRTKRDSG